MIAAINRVLDRTVAAAHTAAHDAGTNPHRALWGAAVVAVPVGTGLAAIGASARPWVPALCALATLLAYHWVYLSLKQALVPGARRQLFVDLALFVLPTFLVFTVAAGESMGAMTDVAALGIPWGIAFLRTGCFLGGCCHGHPAALGVRYPGRAERVLPLPLFEVGAVAVLEIVLLATRGAEGSLLTRLLVSYGLYRFASEFFRAHVKRVGPLTPTQLLAGVAVGIGLAMG